MLPRPRLHRVLRALLGGSILIAALWTLPRLEQFDAGELSVRLQAFGTAAPVLFIVGRILGSIVFVPGSLMAVSAGMLFGPVWGAAYNLVASTGGALAAFGVARYLAPDWVAHRIAGHGRLRRLVEGIETGGWKFVAFVRLVPLFPYNLVNYAFGLTPVRFSHYAWASLVCMIPADIAYVSLGFAGREALAGNHRAWLLAALPLAILAGLTLIPAARRFGRARRAARERIDADR